ELAELRLEDLEPSDPLCSAAIQFERLRMGRIDEFKSECQYRRRDGRLTWVLLSASSMRDGTGKPSQIILQLSDINRQKEAEEALAYNEARWDNALEAAGQGVWDHDIRKDEMFYSRMWRRMRGFGDDEEIDGALEV